MKSHNMAIVYVAWVALIGMGCSDNNDISVTTQAVRTAAGGYVGLDILVTGPGNKAFPCGEEGDLQVTLEVSQSGGAFVPVDTSALDISCTEPGQGDVAIVVDNSGSEAGYLGELQRGIRNVLRGLLPAGGRASLTRVSTNAEIRMPLTDDADALEQSNTSLWINKGYTALYDGIRMANETLGGAVIADKTKQTYSDAANFCSASRKLGIIAFTDGRENNSSDQNASKYDSAAYPGDGLDTTLEDLHNLRVEDITTPIYTIGLGENADHEAMEELAYYTGGRHRRIDNPGDLPHVFEDVGEYFAATHQVCTQLSDLQCGDVTLRVTYSYMWNKVKRVKKTKEFAVHVPCDAVLESAPKGRVVTMLVAFSAPGVVDTDAAAKLASQAALWVGRSADAKILLVKDDNHHNEFKNDINVVEKLLKQGGFTVDVVNEPTDGFDETAFVGYDVVWLSNPGYPMDDQKTFDALRAFAQAGGGVVLQGDDMSWAYGKAFSMANMTHLEHADNGTNYCGENIDDGRGGPYTITFASAEHPVIAGLADMTLTYADDIDTSEAINSGETVLATATIRKGRCHETKPVIVAVEY